MNEMTQGSVAGPSPSSRLGELVHSFQVALKHETWGDLVEAEGEYISLERSMRSFLSSPLHFSKGITCVLVKILLSVVLRHKYLSGREVLEDSVGSTGPTTTDMKEVLKTFEDICKIEKDGCIFNITLPKFPQFIDSFRR